jgi:hypothetical protein
LPRERSIRRDFPEGEADVDAAFDQDDRILWRDCLKLRAGTEPRRPATNQARAMVRLFDTEHDDFLRLGTRRRGFARHEYHLWRLRALAGLTNERSLRATPRSDSLSETGSGEIGR